MPSRANPGVVGPSTGDDDGTDGKATARETDEVEARRQKDDRNENKRQKDDDEATKRARGGQD